MRFLIYIPGDKTVKGQDVSKEAKFHSVGLEDIVEGAQAHQCPTGPDGTGGHIFGWFDSKCADSRYVPEQQTWLKSSPQWGGEHGAYWVGIWNDNLPTEEGLRRPDHRDGVPIRLGDDDTWMVPTPNTITRFPHFDPTTGRLQLVPDEKFNWLFTDLKKLIATRVTENDDDPQSVILSFDMSADFGFLCRLMQINYRITPEVIAHLQLWSERAIRETIASLMGYPLLEA